jgi:hypothetical protein
MALSVDLASNRYKDIGAAVLAVREESVAVRVCLSKHFWSTWSALCQRPDSLADPDLGGPSGLSVFSESS